MGVNLLARVPMFRWLGALLLALTALVTSACETPATQVLVQLDTDLPESRTVVVRVAAQQIDGDGGTYGRVTNWTFTRGGPLGEHQLPGTFGVTPPPGAARDARVQLVVSVFVAANSVVEPALFFRRTVRFRFTPNRTLGIGVFLSLACGEPATGCTGVAPGDCNVSTLCEERGLTCGDRAECIAGDVMPRDLDAGFRDDTSPLDATLDAEPSDAAVIRRCTMSDDECDATDHCDTTARLCVAGCHDDTGCPLRSAQHCDTTMHACVACTTDAHCPTDTRCAGGLCVPGCADATQCSPGQSCCGGLCLDTLANTAACGACGSACAPANAVPACVGGACTIRECTAPYLDCNHAPDDGCEANRLTSATHCGACGRACTAGANATASCVAGSCVRECAAGFADCNGDPSDGCEVTLATDSAHCGACGRSCAIANGTGACVAGACTVATCATGFADCNASIGDGCEADTTNDPSNCGGCGTVCAPPPGAGGFSCGAGVCTYTCDMHRGDCDGDPSTGCEADLAFSASNCGMCGRTCSFPHATPQCWYSACQIQACATGWGNCDGATTNGCETDLTNTVTSCGGCGNACTPVANATRACRDAVCQVDCAADYFNCDAVVDNGCEVGPASAFPVPACTNIAPSATITSTGSPYVYDFLYMTDANFCTKGLATAPTADFMFTFPAARSIRGVTATGAAYYDSPNPAEGMDWEVATSTDGTTFTTRRVGTAMQNQTWFVDLGANEMLRAIRIRANRSGYPDPGIGFRNVIIHSCP